MLKKEDIYVKLTKKNVDKVVSILEERCIEYDFPNSKRYLKDGVYEELYLSYHQVFNCYRWVVSLYEPIKTRIKPKELRDILLEEWKTYKLTNSTHDLKTGEITFTVEKPKGYSSKTNYEVVPMSPKKQLEIGKWYKEPTFYKGRLMFKFNGKFGDAVATGFATDGEFASIIGVHERYIDRYEEATPEEVVKAFEYHFENFYD